MELQRGISGFRYASDPLLPECDISKFRTHCHAAVRMLSGRVVQVFDRSPSSFVMGVVEIPSGPIAILLNRHFPVIGLAVPLKDDGDLYLQFLDCDELADSLTLMGGNYDILSRAELERPISKMEVQRLSPAEIKQVRYWRSTRVGDIVFNFWD